MDWNVITVPKVDLGLALGAIALGGGMVTATRPRNSDVEITYVTRPGAGARSPRP